jgi:hypothetical protein
VLFAFSTEELASDSLEDFALVEFASVLAWEVVLGAVQDNGLIGTNATNKSCSIRA